MTPDTAPVETPVETPTPEIVEAPKSELETWKAARHGGTNVVEAPAPPPPVPVEEPAEPPEPPVAAASRWEDPDTGEVLDMQTRRAKRIHKLWSEREAVKAEVASLKQKLAAQSAPPPAAGAPVSPPSPAPAAAADADAKPTLDQFTTEADPYLALTEATARWAARHEHAKLVDAQRAEQQRATAQTTTQQRAQHWDAAVPEVVKRYADFEAVTGTLAESLPKDVRGALIAGRLLEAEHGHDLAYFLGTHPEELTRLYQAPSVESYLLMLGKLEAKVDADLAAKAPAPVPPTPPTTHAPPPVTPLTGGGPAASPDPATMNLAQWKERRKALGLTR